MDIIRNCPGNTVLGINQIDFQTGIAYLMLSEPKVFLPVNYNLHSLIWICLLSIYNNLTKSTFFPFEDRDGNRT